MTAPAFDRDAAARHLELFVPDADYPAGAAVVLFLLPSKACASFDPADRAGALAWAEEGVAARENVYLHVALHDRAKIAGRGTNDSAVALTVLFDDVDALVPGHRHKSEKLPPDLETARAFVSSMPWLESAVVASGFGVYPIWALREPLILADPSDRAVATTLLARYSAHRDARAREAGWTFDSVFDFARVLRLAGTVNFKNPDLPRPVRFLVERPHMRFNPGNLLDVLDPLPPSQTVPAGIAAPTPEEARDLAGRLVTWAIRRAAEAGRNPAGFDLAVQLRDAGLTAAEAVVAGSAFVRFVDSTWPARRYGARREFEESIRQAFRRPAREPLPELWDYLGVDLVGTARPKVLRRLTRELLFHRVPKPLVEALVLLTNEARCRPYLEAADVVALLDEQEAAVKNRRRSA